MASRPGAQLGRQALDSHRGDQDSRQVTPFGFCGDKVAHRQAFLRVVLFSPANFIPPLHHIQSCIVWGTNIQPVSGPVLRKHSLNPSQ